MQSTAIEMLNGFGQGLREWVDRLPRVLHQNYPITWMHCSGQLLSGQERILFYDFINHQCQIMTNDAFRATVAESQETDRPYIKSSFAEFCLRCVVELPSECIECWLGSSELKYRLGE